ncbi:MAG: hypothetical protein RR049_06970, partial [Angelakisella sp.]
MPSKTKKSSRYSRYAAPIGGVFIILCVIGFCTLLVACFNLTRNILDNSNTKHAYEAKLLPVLMFDPPNFEDPKALRSVDLLMYSVWATVLGDKRDTYQYDDNLSLIIPASDVEMTAFNLLGPDVKLVHDTFGDYETTYLYDTATKSYHVPTTAMTGFYTPSVEEIVKSGDTLRLRVGYIPPATALNIDFSGKGDRGQKADKYKTYELHKGKNGYYLYAIRDVEGATLLTGSGANPLLNDALDEINAFGNEAETPVLEFLPTPSSEAVSSGSTAEGEGISAGSSSDSDSSSDASSGSSSGASSNSEESTSSKAPSEVQ